jgi:hypothetical protein
VNKNTYIYTYVQSQDINAGVYELHKARTVTVLKMTAFWDIAPCSLVEVFRRFIAAYCLHYRPDDGGSTHF